MNLNLTFSKVMTLTLKIKKYLDPSPTRTLTHSILFMTPLRSL